MPASGAMPAPERTALVKFVRTLEPRADQSRISVKLQDGSTLNGVVLGRTGRELQLRSADDHIHLLRNMGGERFREATSQADWATFNGQLNGNRLSTVTRIDRSNVGRLAPKWVLPGAECRPVAGDTAGGARRHVRACPARRPGTARAFCAAGSHLAHRFLRSGDKDRLLDDRRDHSLRRLAQLRQPLSPGYLDAAY